MSNESQNFAQMKYRRGTILGLTVAEIFILLLFLLMLVFLVLNQDQRAREDAKDQELVELREYRRTWEKSLTGIETPDEIMILRRWQETVDSPQGNTPEELKRLLVETEQQRDAAETELQRAIEGNERLASQANRQREELETQAQTLEQLHQLTAELRDRIAGQESALAEASNQRDALGVELAEEKAGELVICTYEPPSPDRGSPLRGRSIPLGTVHLEADGVTLIERNDTLRNSRIVDYIGDDYDADEAIEILEGWALHEKINFEELESIGNQFIAIGDRAVLTRSRCRFSMDYYIEDYITPHSVLLEFERFFFQQSRISDDQFEQLADVAGRRRDGVSLRPRSASDNSNNVHRPTTGQR